MILKREVKDKWKRGKEFLLIILSLCFLLTTIAAASAADVAYIYKKNYKVDENVLDVFFELGLSYKLIDERYLPRDFSDYKLIFVGDERFANANKIPVDEKPSIISNYYFGEEFGLTDYDGISQLAATAPLRVRKDNKVIQVYTQAKYSSGISIPYYYLDDKNKAPGMTTVARTYTGNDNYYDFGDVISYANPGTKLINGKNTEGKLCFFGIIESEYWTAAARQLFKDCVGFVAITCSKDSDCGEEEEGENYCKVDDVYKDVTSYSCINPGTVKSECKKDVNSELIEECEENELCEDGECRNIECYTDADCDDNNDYTKDICEKSGTPESYCKHEILQCLKKLDCGTDRFIRENYCQDNKVYQDYINFSCSGNRCSNLTSAKLIENCTDICRNGGCVERECVEDSDCTADYYSENYCEGDSVYKDLHDFSCQQETCQENVIKESVDECSVNEECSNGECKTIVCKKHVDCGINKFTGNKYCENENVYEDFISFTCHKPETIDSYCSDYTLPILAEYCDFSCVSGECITCFNNLSCGTDRYIGEKYCQDNSVYQNYQMFECINPATPESDCLSSVYPKLIEQCDELCVNGECRDIECYEDTDCNDFNVYTVDECNNPGTPDSYCTNTEVNCITNNDCGNFTGFFGQEYCYEEDVYKNYKNSTCINRGTKESYCDISTEPRFLIDCGEDECSSWQNYCKDNNVYRNRSCFNRGCLNGGCLSKINVQEELVKECGYGCENGECIGKHDVALIDFSNSIGGIRLEHTNGTDILEDPAVLFCNNKYKVYITLKNLGNYYENVTFNGEIDSLLFSHEPKNNLAPNDSSLKYKTVNFTLPSGFYNITVEAIIPFDNIPENNFAYREIKIMCIEEPICGDGNLNAGEECDDGTSNGIPCTPPYGGSCTYCSVSCEIINLTDGYCGDGNIDIGYEECEINEDCDDQNPDTTDICNSCICEYEEIICNEDSDCGIDHWLEQEYCKCTSNVWDTWIEYTCEAPGTPQSSCSSNGTAKLKEDCGDDYCTEWQNYCEGKNVRKTRTCYDKGCLNASCFSHENVQDEFVGTCLYDCENGSCVDECTEDNDCNNDYYEDNYCSNDDVYHDLHDFSCQQGSCNENIIPELVEECGESYCEEWEYYCKDNDVYKERTCHEKGCVDGECYDNSYNEDELVKECEYGCLNGECIEECTEKIIDWYDTKYLSSEVKENEGDVWKKVSEFIDLEPKVEIFEPFKSQTLKMQTAVNIENDGYLIFKNKMRDGGVVIIKPLLGDVILIQAIDSAVHCPGKNDVACMYSRDGKLLYSYKIATHSTTPYSKVLEHEKYIGECPDKTLQEIANDKELPNLYCGFAETKVELKAEDVVYFKGEDSNEKAGSGIEIWENC